MAADMVDMVAGMANMEEIGGKSSCIGKISIDL